MSQAAKLRFIYWSCFQPRKRSEKAKFERTPGSPNENEMHSYFERYNSPGIVRFFPRSGQEVVRGTGEKSFEAD